MPSRLRTRRPRRRSSPSLMAWRGLAAGASARRAFRRPTRPTRRCTSRRARPLRRLTAGYYGARRRPLLDSRDSVLRRHQAVACSSAPAGRPVLDGPPPTIALLYPLLDLTTTLDPRFNIAYRFGAIFLAEPYPGGAGRPDLAIALLEKGLRARPDKWEYMQDIGFVHYWWRHDYPAAAEWFDRASQVPGAPWWLKSLAATTLAEGGDRALVAHDVGVDPGVGRNRLAAKRRRAAADAARRPGLHRPRCRRDVDRATRAPARSRRDWPALVRAGASCAAFRSIRAGRRYEIDADGRVRLSRESPLFPLPEEPQHAAPLPRHDRRRVPSSLAARRSARSSAAS